MPQTEVPYLMFEAAARKPGGSRACSRDVGGRGEMKRTARDGFDATAGMTCIDPLLPGAAGIALL